LPPDLGLWLEALAARARQCAPAVVDACRQRLPSARRVLELGGGHGEYGLEFVRRGFEVTMQDRPEVVDLVRDRLAAAGVSTFVGDLFETMPEGPFDLIFCAGINHTYDAERNQALCRRAAEVTSPEGALGIVTYLRGRDAMAPTFAVQMLVGGGGGDTHAEDDYRRWLSVAGLPRVEVVDGGHPRESLLLARRGQEAKDQRTRR
jgi:2-polyprenyl-3-methyl-5-hydroxy-6-metoxy-1,4-benzoquinol methylase